MSYILVIGNHYPTEEYPTLGIFPADQAKALRSIGCNIVYAAIDMRSFRRPRKFGIYKTLKDNLEIYTVSVPMGAIPRELLIKISQISFSLLYRKLVKEKGKPLLVHSHFLDTSEAVYPTCTRNNIPLFVTEHSSHLNQESIPEKIQIRAAKVYPKATTLITVSNALRRNIKQQIGYDSVVIPNIVDASNFHFSEEIPKHEGFTYVSAGNLIEIKGYDTLLRAFALHLEDYPNSKLEIFGDGPLYTNLVDLSEELGISKQVVFRRRQPRHVLAQSYTQAHAYILLSRTETFGVSYIEAMASGLPVIATRCGGPQDFINQNVGYLVDVDDVYNAFKMMNQLIKNYEYFNKAAISAYAIEMFSPEEIANQIVTLYKRSLDIDQRRLIE